MAEKVNVELLAKAYCEVLTRNTGIQHYYTIKKDVTDVEKNDNPENFKRGG